MNRQELEEEMDYIKHNIDRIEESVRNIRKVLIMVCKAIDKEEYKTFLTMF